MPRIARIVAPGLPHRVTQRGNRRMQTFFRDEGYQEYMTLPAHWREHLLEPEAAELAAAMRHRENTGGPLGDRDFVQRLGAQLGRDLLPKKPGPQGPRRKANT